METDLQHEDLLIRLRAKLNEEKVKLWEAPFLTPDNETSQKMQELANKYSEEMSVKQEIILKALQELQLHSVDRSKANAAFKETGCATFRVKATIPGEKPRVIKVQKRLDTMGSELIAVVASEVGVAESRIKLIVNGKVIKPTLSLEEQGVKNGVQIMALIMAETPEEAQKEDTLYKEMKATRDDATLLSECVDELADDDEYMKLEDQSGKSVELPLEERRALLVGLALHERGRSALRLRDYALALVLMLEADRHFRSSILSSVDNWALLQLDIAWCYLALRSLPAAADAARRLAAAEASLLASYGPQHQRLIALQGSSANERVLLMRLYLLQGIVAFHQNKRTEAKELLDKAETELNALRVDETAVVALMELGWSRGQARCGLRAAAGAVDAAHHFLAQRRGRRLQARDAHRADRQRRALGACEDGSAVSGQLLEAMVAMGFVRRRAALALRCSNNHVAEAVRLLQEQPELLQDSDDSSDSTPSEDESTVEPDDKLVADLQAMGYEADAARAALRRARNLLPAALDLLLAGGGAPSSTEDPTNPSTSSGAAADVTPKTKRQKKEMCKHKKEREQALRRLTSAIKTEEDDYLDTSLAEEEDYLAQYKSLL